MIICGIVKQKGELIPCLQLWSVGSGFIPERHAMSYDFWMSFIADGHPS
jgi:hypothetical protein